MLYPQFFSSFFLDECTEVLTRTRSISAGGQAAGYGQNIGYGVSADNIGSMITGMMYNDEMEDYPGYGQASPDMKHFDDWGHFSQIVWNGTTKVGCVTVVCQNLGNAASSEPLPFTVCNFSPAGKLRKIPAMIVLVLMLNTRER